MQFWINPKNGDLVIEADPAERFMLAVRQNNNEPLVNIFYDFYGPLFETDSFDAHYLDQPWVACWGGPVIIHTDEAGKIDRAWAWANYALYSDIDELIRTGEARWLNFTFESEDLETEVDDGYSTVTDSTVDA